MKDAALEPNALLPPQRDLFDLPRDVVWMNTAQMSVAPKSAVAAGIDGVRLKQTPWMLPQEAFFETVEHTRAAFGRVAGLDPEGVALVPSASYALATAAANIPVRRGARILVMEQQFPSNVYVWRRLAAERALDVATIARGPDGDATAPLLDAIDDATGLIACAGAHWTDGAPVDLAAVSKAARRVGAALVLDLCQSLGAVPHDFAAIDPDFIAAPTYKWLLGPYSSGFLYVAARWRDGRPLEETWMNRENAENFAGLVNYCDAYAPGARRFDMGQKSQFHTLPMTLTALELLAEWRPARIARSLAALNARLAQGLAARGFALSPGPNSPHFFGVSLPETAPTDLAARLAADKVFVSVRGTKLRISPHLWIDAEDEARFFDALDRHLR